MATQLRKSWSHGIQPSECERLFACQGHHQNREHAQHLEHVDHYVEARLHGKRGARGTRGAPVSLLSRLCMRQDAFCDARGDATCRSSSIHDPQQIDAHYRSDDTKDLHQAHQARMNQRPRGGGDAAVGSSSAGRSLPRRTAPTQQTNRSSSDVINGSVARTARAVCRVLRGRLKECSVRNGARSREGRTEERAYRC